MSVTYPHAIPTPPISPLPQSMASDSAPPHLKSTINLLDSLIAYYQQERMWVYRTRAELDGYPKADASASAVTPTPSTPPEDHATIAKVEETNDLPDAESSGSAKNITSASSRWSKRKKGFKLRLEISQPRIASTVHPVAASSSRSGSIPQREHILEMFEKMMESRMESCERLNRLVRNANRAHLFHRR
ncbi:hypothetical protein FA15DRAFT_752826 [Coprinopsis marcescibilis]|uniref:Uncharacterized protein n=1 Tax=Coprinopsis marcescibilis TaxID=230819 RepID=A0A5C3LBL7_COPMA|nr:hypothetical protein FA15DRAFT_752826 [Coprinopsis marcescibilis]